MTDFIFGLAGGNSAMSMILWLAILFPIMYFLMIRPQRKQMEKRNRMLDSLVPGTRVVTAGGITGYIRAVTDDYLYVEIAEGLTIELTKQGVAAVIDEEDDEDDDDDDDDDVEEVEVTNVTETTEQDKKE